MDVGHLVQPNLPDAAFTSTVHLDKHGHEHACDLADTRIGLTVTPGPRAGETISLRQVTRRKPDRPQPATPVAHP
jgi:hypothetical protein